MVVFFGLFYSLSPQNFFLPTPLINIPVKFKNNGSSPHLWIFIDDTDTRKEGLVVLFFRSCFFRWSFWKFFVDALGHWLCFSCVTRPAKVEEHKHEELGN